MTYESSADIFMIGLSTMSIELNFSIVFLMTSLSRGLSKMIKSKNRRATNEND